MTFEDWWDKFALTEINGNLGFNARKIWEAAQQAERERILKIVEQVGIQGNHNEWLDCCDTIVERIKND